MTEYKAPGWQWKIDLYAEGSCVYKVDKDGDIIELVAWASNGGAARRAIDYLRKEYPTERFEQRRRSYVESSAGNYEKGY